MKRKEKEVRREVKREYRRYGKDGKRRYMDELRIGGGRVRVS